MNSYELGEYRKGNSSRHRIHTYNTKAKYVNMLFATFATHNRSRCHGHGHRHARDARDRDRENVTCVTVTCVTVTRKTVTCVNVTCVTVTCVTVTCVTVIAVSKIFHPNLKHIIETHSSMSDLRPWNTPAGSVVI